MEYQLLADYKERKRNISFALNNFKNLSEERYFDEFIFCTLTPQSNARKCWEAVEQLKDLKRMTKQSIKNVLKTKTRFHNNKSAYIIYNLKNWDNIKNSLDNKNRIELRNFIADNVKGYGLKEASHFLRNIGKSDNQIAILDRHILRNLKSLGIIEDEKIRNNNHYLEIEKKFIDFSRRIGIQTDALDLLFWSKETGEVFK